MPATINFPTSLDDATSMPEVTPYDQANAPGVEQDNVINRLIRAVKALEVAVGITSASTAATSGSGSPEGVVAGGAGRLYTDTTTDPPSLWVKIDASANTGWRQLIA